MTVTLIGTVPTYAVILWTRPNEVEPSCRTKCFDEEEVQDNLKTTLNPNHYRYGWKANLYYSEKEEAIA